MSWSRKGLTERPRLTERYRESERLAERERLTDRKTETDRAINSAWVPVCVAALWGIGCLSWVCSNKLCIGKELVEQRDFPVVPCTSTDPSTAGLKGQGPNSPRQVGQGPGNAPSLERFSGSHLFNIHFLLFEASRRGVKETKRWKQGLPRPLNEQGNYFPAAMWYSNTNMGRT